MYARSAAIPAPCMVAPSRILVVDDDLLFLDAATTLLRAAGYEVRTAGSVEEADQRLAETPHDLVIADIHIPGNERLEWVRALTRSTARPAVLLCTGFPAIDTAIDAVTMAPRGQRIAPSRRQAIHLPRRREWTPAPLSR